MTHPSEQDLVLFVTGDADQMSEIERHVDNCSDCKHDLEEIERLLQATRDLPVPEPDAGFEKRIWDRQRAMLHSEMPTRELDAVALEPAAAEVIRPRFWSMPRLALAGSVAAMLLVAFLAGLYTSPPGTEIVPEDEVGKPGRDRVLLVAVGDHLERTRMVLVELVNAESENGSVDISAQQARAEALLGDNRLYRQSADLSGEREMADLLAEIERVLLEVARGPEEVGEIELAWLRDRIQSRDLLFKVKVIEGRSRWDEGTYLRPMDAL